MEIRKAKLKDDLYKIASLIYGSDRFIFPYWLKSEDNLEPIVEMIKTPTAAYYYKNILVVTEGEKIIAIGISFDSKTDLSCDYKTWATNFRARHTMKEYFIPLKEHNEAGCLYISNICVDKAYRRRQYGKKLLNYIIDNTKHKRVALTVIADNTPALSLYKKVGFEIKEELKGFNGPLKKKPLIYNMEKIKASNN